MFITEALAKKKTWQAGFAANASGDEKLIPFVWPNNCKFHFEVFPSFIQWFNHWCWTPAINQMQRIGKHWVCEHYHANTCHFYHGEEHQYLIWKHTDHLGGLSAYSNRKQRCYTNFILWKQGISLVKHWQALPHFFSVVESTEPQIQCREGYPAPLPELDQQKQEKHYFSPNPRSFLRGGGIFRLTATQVGQIKAYWTLNRKRMYSTSDYYGDVHTSLAHTHLICTSSSK